MKNKNSVEGLAHAKLSPSAMERWSVCPASIRLSEGIPSTTSKYAKEGTKAHEAAAFYLSNIQWPEGTDEETIGFLKVYTDYILDTQKSCSGELFIEKRFSLEKIVPDMFGTTDAAIYDAHAKALHIVDLKYGAGIAVEVKGNVQMRCYALGAMLSLPHLRVDKVIITIIQPRADHHEGVIRSEEIDVLALMDFASELEKFAAATKSYDAPVVSGEHCRFCPAAAICPELTKTSNELAAMDFSAATAYDPKTLSEVLNKLPLLSGWIDSVKEFAYSEMCAGRPIPGWKLVAKRANRSWISETKAMDTLRTVLEEEEMLEVKFKSPAQIEKTLGTKNKKLLEPLVQSISTGTTIAPETDKREAVDREAKAALDFK